MPIRDRQTIPTRLADVIIQVTDDGSRTLIRSDSQDAYHSGSGAITETRHVYLDNSLIAQRIAQGRRVSVLELGLGTGMGLLLTADAAVRAGVGLHYVSFENDWLPADVLAQLDPQSWVAKGELAESFLSFREGLPPLVAGGSYRWRIGENQSAVIQVCDIISHTFQPDRIFDAIYFDPFAPLSDARLWQPELLSRLLAVLKPAGRLVTYCVNRPVREAMVQAGFAVQRVAGPAGGKREVLIATKGQ